MTNDNKPNLRVVENAPGDETKKEIITRLRHAIEVVEEDDQCLGVMISLVKRNGDIVNIVSATDSRHMMVAAALYQVFDLAGFKSSEPDT